MLFLSQRVPYPPDRGDKITTFRLVERLAERFRVTAIAFAHDEADVEAARELTERGVRTVAVPLGSRTRRRLRLIPRLVRGEPLTLGFYGSAELQREVDRAVVGVDLAYAYSSSMAAFLMHHEGLKRVMHFAELDSDKWRQYAAREPFPKNLVYAREARTLLEFERDVAHSFDANVLCTPLEQEVFTEHIPDAPSVVVRNGVDLEHLVPAPDRSEPGHCVFVGVMDYLPNTDGVRWFAEEILPRIRAEVGDAHLTIVGSRPTPEVQALGERDGIEVTGYVAEPRDVLARAAVSVAPLRIARGIQNKVLEAMAMGLPVVGTTSATQGVEAEAGEHFLLADEPEAFATAVVQCLREPARARQLGRAARAFVESHYAWDRVLEPFDALIDSLIPV